MNIPDHPDVANALATGYPGRECRCVLCAGCTREITWSPKIMFEDEPYCEECGMDIILENYTPRELCNALGIKTED